MSPHPFQNMKRSQGQQPSPPERDFVHRRDPYESYHTVMSEKSVIQCAIYGSCSRRVYVRTVQMRLCSEVSACHGSCRCRASYGRARFALGETHGITSTPSASCYPLCCRHILGYAIRVIPLPRLYHVAPSALRRVSGAGTQVWRRGRVAEEAHAIVQETPARPPMKEDKTRGVHRLSMRCYVLQRVS